VNLKQKDVASASGQCYELGKKEAACYGTRELMRFQLHSQGFGGVNRSPQFVVFAMAHYGGLFYCQITHSGNKNGS
jgi:hypothetical protein